MTPLERWLVAATHNLSAESAAQVRAEIREHYQSAYEAGLVLGSPSQEADLAAVMALGDARSVNRQYRRVLLTAREAKRLHWISFDPSSSPPRRVTTGEWAAQLLTGEADLMYDLANYAGPGKWAVRLLIAGDAAVLALSAWKYPDFRYLGAVLVGLLLSGWLPVDTEARGRRYRWIKWTALIGGAALAGWHGKPWAPLAVLFLAAYSDYLGMSIRRKLPIDRWPKQLYR